MTLDKRKKQGILGRAAILWATVMWGVSFVVLKNALDEMSTFYIMAFRFTGAALILLLIGIKQLKRIDRAYLKHGALMGVFLFAAYTLQTYGLVYTTPGKNAFLTAAYCVMVPFFNWFVYKSRPDGCNILAAVVCLTGMGLVSLNGDLSVGLGDGLTALCGIFYALHIIVTARAVKGRDVLPLTMIQFAVVALLAWVGAVTTEPFPSGVSVGSVLAIVFLCVFCTAGSLLLQSIGQKFTPPSAAAVLLTFESVFGVLASVLFYDEVINARLLCGFALIFVAVIISETKLAFLKKPRGTPPRAAEGGCELSSEQPEPEGNHV